MAYTRYLYIVVPTFCETDFVKTFLESWARVNSVIGKIFVCNGNPGDETSKLIERVGTGYPHTVIEVRGHPNLFWSGLVEMGLKQVQEVAQPNDLCLLMNIDISFQVDPLPGMLRILSVDYRQQIAALVRGSDGRFLSAGVAVRSWCMSRNKHLFQGIRGEDVDRHKLVAATYLPTRFVLFPAQALSDAGLPSTCKLPHYGADYEFTNRLRLHGFKPYVFTGAVVHNVETNTGFKTFQQKTSLRQRLSSCFELKCPYNLKRRFWFVWLTYPARTRIPGLVTHFIKIFVEILLGGHSLRR